MPKINENMDFRPVGDFGIEFAIDGDHLHLRMPTSVAGARRSASGKTDVTASSGGWTSLPGTDLRMNVNVGKRVS